MEIVKVAQSDAFPVEIKNLKNIQADSTLRNGLSDKEEGSYQENERSA